MDLGIKGRKAIVNGGSAGMGRGAELYVSARGEIMRETGADITPIVADPQYG